MIMRRKVAVAAVVVAAAAAVGAGAAIAANGDDNESPITGTELEQASTAALAHTGGGRVSDTEVGDEDSYYEVEVTLDDGRQIDVQLDRGFNVVGDVADDVADDDPATDD